jgi:hypothetical protein
MAVEKEVHQRELNPCWCLLGACRHCFTTVVRSTSRRRGQLIAERASELGNGANGYRTRQLVALKQVTAHQIGPPEIDRPGQTSERVRPMDKAIRDAFLLNKLFFLVKCSTTESGKRILSCWLATRCCKQFFFFDKDYSTDWGWIGRMENRMELKISS